MEERDYLVKAQEAEALADVAENYATRAAWENVAREYRRLALLWAATRRDGSVRRDDTPSDTTV